MQRRNYDWQRFWCPTTGNLNLDYSGFLYDPESEYGSYYNRNVVKFDAISDIPCLILLGEAGIGKTTAIEQEYEKVKNRLQRSQDDCLCFSLGDYDSDNNLCNAIFKNERFKNWLDETHKLHLFLDSLDEGLLSIKILTRILKREINQLPCDRLYLRITCRTADWKHTLTGKFQEKWQQDNVKTYELCPLRRIDIIDAANKQNIDADRFLEELADKQAVPLAIKPITLKFLLSTYLKNGSFPLSQKELYEQGCLELCKEANQDRLDCDFKGKLSDKQRLIIAARIAAITIFANKVAIWTSQDCTNKPESDIAIQDLCIGNEKIDGQKFDITSACIEEVLSISGLFSSRGNSRMGFAHKTYAEFLAAWYLSHHQIPLVQIMSLIVSPEDAARKLVPQLHETAAWLASLNHEVLGKIMITDPDVLLYSDVSEDANLREAIVSNLLEKYEQEKLFNRGLGNHLRCKKLKHPKLAEQLRSYIKDTNKNLNARYEAINIAEVCEVKELQDDLVNLALDRTQQIHLRSIAANTIVSIGDSNTKARLKLLAIEKLSEDEDDRLKGSALISTRSEHLTVEELFNCLTPPKRKSFFGSYQRFLEYELILSLESEDLLTALNWVKKQGLRGFDHPFEKLCDCIVLKAWKFFDIPGIAEVFAEIALIQWTEYRNIITHERIKNDELDSLIAKEDNKRRKLVEHLVDLLSSLENMPRILVRGGTEDLPLRKDIFWMLEEIQKPQSHESQKVWAKLIDNNFDRQDAKQIDKIITTTFGNTILKEQFGSHVEAIELDSDEAKNQKAFYLYLKSHENQHHHEPLVEPSPSERINIQLNKLETGDLNAWWILCREMTLEPDSRYYDNEFEYDLTNLPGWKNSDIVTRNRIVKGAKKYILEQQRIDYEWIGTNKFNRPALAGVKAFILIFTLIFLQQESSIFLDSLSAVIWRIWTPVIVGIPGNDERMSIYHKLVALTYKKAPDEAINTLNILVDEDNERRGDTLALKRFTKCWDNRLMSVVLEKAKDTSLTPKCMGNLLEELFGRNYIPAQNYVRSLITYPFPSIEEARERAIIASQLLIEYPSLDLWSVFWSTLQLDNNFGHEVLESMISHDLRSANPNLAENQIAEFYIWLVKNYPYKEDPEHDEFHFVGNRESIGHLRDSMLDALRNLGTPQACQEVQRIVNHFPELDWLKVTLFDAQKNTRIKTWQTPAPAEIFKLVRDRQKRLVNDGNELLAVLIESLQRLEIELQGETPAARDVWDLVNSKPLKYKPVDENTFSGYVKRFLDRNLKQRGIIANREVELRPNQGGALGERTDIHVDAVIRNSNGEVDDSITVIIEVKGCWHKELDTAMETQLVNRYLQDNTCKHGLYLVAWFNCPQWDDSDYRKRNTPNISLEEAKKQFNRQAESLSLDVIVKAFVLNTALR